MVDHFKICIILIIKIKNILFFVMTYEYYYILSVSV